MKKCLVAALIAASLAAHADTLEVKQPAKPAQTLQLSSPDIQDGATLTLAQVADSFGCSGKNLSPALQWTGVPKEAKSLVLTVNDVPAPFAVAFFYCQLDCHCAVPGSWWMDGRILRFSQINIQLFYFIFVFQYIARSMVMGVPLLYYIS